MSPSYTLPHQGHELLTYMNNVLICKNFKFVCVLTGMYFELISNILIGQKGMHFSYRFWLRWKEIFLLTGYNKTLDKMMNDASVFFCNGLLHGTSFIRYQSADVECFFDLALFVSLDLHRTICSYFRDLVWAM